MNDTSPKINEIWRENLQKLTPAERLEMACSQFEFAKDLVKESILQHSPNISANELEKRVFLRFYEKDFQALELEKIFKRFGW